MLNTHLSIHCKFHSCYFYTPFFSPSSHQLNENTTHNNQVSLLRIWWRMIDVGTDLKRRKSFTIRKWSLTLHVPHFFVINMHTFADVNMCGWWIPTIFFYITISMVLFIVNDDVNVHQNDRFMLWETKICGLPSKWSRLFPRIWSLIRFVLFGTFRACLMPTEFWSKCPGPDFGTCELQ